MGSPVGFQVYRTTLNTTLKLCAIPRHHHIQMLVICLLLMTTLGYAAEIRTDIEYSRAGGTSLRLDASIPEGTGPFPAAVIVHGGGWVRGDKKIDVAPLFKPLSDAGIAWFSINYRLADDPLLFGIAIHDVEAAVRFVKDN